MCWQWCLASMGSWSGGRYTSVMKARFWCLLVLPSNSGWSVTSGQEESVKRKWTGIYTRTCRPCHSGNEAWFLFVTLIPKKSWLLMTMLLTLKTAIKIIHSKWSSRLKMKEETEGNENLRKEKFGWSYVRKWAKRSLKSAGKFSRKRSAWKRH